MASKRETLGQIVIRPPEGMRERIKAAAEGNNRSMNAEIVATLEDAYPAPAYEYDDVNQYLVDTVERAERISKEIERCLKAIESAKSEDEVFVLSDRFRGLTIVEKQVRNEMMQAYAKVKMSGSRTT